MVGRWASRLTAASSRGREYRPFPIARPMVRSRCAVGISYGLAARWGHRALPHITPAKFPLSRIPWCGPVAVERDVIARGGAR